MSEDIETPRHIELFGSVACNTIYTTVYCILQQHNIHYCILYIATQYTLLGTLLGTPAEYTSDKRASAQHVLNTHINLQHATQDSFTACSTIYLLHATQYTLLGIPAEYTSDKRASAQHVFNTYIMRFGSLLLHVVSKLHVVSYVCIQYRLCTKLHAVSYVCIKYMLCTSSVMYVLNTYITYNMQHKIYLLHAPQYTLLGILAECRSDQWAGAQRPLHGCWSNGPTVTRKLQTRRWHDSCVCATCLIRTCDMTHLRVRHDWFVRVAWLMCMCDMTHSYVWHDSFVCATWLIRTRGMTHVYVRHDSFVRVTWLIRMCDKTHLYAWHDSFMCATWLICMCDRTPNWVWNVWMSLVTHVTEWYDSSDANYTPTLRAGVAYAWHDSFICEKRLIHMCDMTPARSVSAACEWVMSHVWMSHDTHVNESCHTYE